jgi:hypothetical protein
MAGLKTALGRAGYLTLLSIPEALSKRGYTPEVVAARIAAELRRIDREPTTMMSRQPITENRSESIFNYPGTFCHSGLWFGIHELC